MVFAKLGFGEFIFVVSSQLPRLNVEYSQKENSKTRGWLICALLSLAGQIQPSKIEFCRLLNNVSQSFLSQLIQHLVPVSVWIIVKKKNKNRDHEVYLWILIVGNFIKEPWRIKES